MRDKAVKAAKTALIAVSVFMLSAPMALAEQATDSNYGKRAGDWFLDNLKTPWKAIVAGAACMFILPGARKPSIIGGFVLAVFITGALIFAGGTVTDMIVSVTKSIAGAQ